MGKRETHKYIQSGLVHKFSFSDFNQPPRIIAAGRFTNSEVKDTQMNLH